MKNNISKKIYFLSISLILGFCGFSILAVHNHGKELCKKAGWEFIEEVVFPKRLLEEDSIIFTKEQKLKRLRFLQSNVATKCIVRF